MQPNDIGIMTFGIMPFVIMASVIMPFVTMTCGMTCGIMTSV